MFRAIRKKRVDSNDASVKRFLKSHRIGYRITEASAEMSENHRSQTEKNKTNAKRITTAMLSGAAGAPSSSTSSSGVQSSAANEPEQESSPQTRRPNQSIRGAHPAIYLNTRSHRLLRRAIRIWKMPIPILNYTRSLKPKPRSFRERLKRVEMLRNRTEVSISPNPMTRSVRDLQLCSSGTDSSPSPSSSSPKTPRSLRSRPVQRSRRYRKQLQLYRMLSSSRRREKQHRLEGQSSAAASTSVKGSSEVQDDCTDSSSTQNPSVIHAPSRKTSRRLWRRQLDSSSSETSPLTANPVNSVRAGKTDKQSQNRRVTFSFSDVSNESAEFEFSDINTSATEEASAAAQRNITGRDSSDLKPDDEEPTQISLKITVTNTEDETPDSEASLVSRLKIFKEELEHCEDAAEIKQEPAQFKNPSSIAPRDKDVLGPKSSVKWKSVMMQRALCSSTVPSENQDPTCECCRFTPPGVSDRSDTDRADLKPEDPEKPAQDLVKNRAAGDAFVPQ